ncbi:hypothetical protein ACFFX0_31320 [Citricoccus parietis]|uniref:Uncharacterized protein n=1 Tax=Citricoccus parietis TaxID=592307 RepID=A0ABV5G903_9MICC
MARLSGFLTGGRAGVLRWGGGGAAGHEIADGAADDDQGQQDPDHDLGPALPGRGGVGLGRGGVGGSHGRSNPWGRESGAGV